MRRFRAPSDCRTGHSGGRTGCSGAMARIVAVLLSLMALACTVDSSCTKVEDCGGPRALNWASCSMLNATYGVCQCDLYRYEADGAPSKFLPAEERTCAYSWMDLEPRLARAYFVVNFTATGLAVLISLVGAIRTIQLRQADWHLASLLSFVASNINVLWLNSQHLAQSPRMSNVVRSLTYWTPALAIFVCFVQMVQSWGEIHREISNGVRFEAGLRGRLLRARRELFGGLSILAFSVTVLIGSSLEQYAAIIPLTFTCMVTPLGLWMFYNMVRVHRRLGLCLFEIRDVLFVPLSTSSSGPRAVAPAPGQGQGQGQPKRGSAGDGSGGGGGVAGAGAGNFASVGGSPRDTSDQQRGSAGVSGDNNSARPGAGQGPPSIIRQADITATVGSRSDTYQQSALQSRGLHRLRRFATLSTLFVLAGAVDIVITVIGANLGYRIQARRQLINNMLINLTLLALTAVGSMLFWPVVHWETEPGRMCCLRRDAVRPVRSGSIEGEDGCCPRGPDHRFARFCCCLCPVLGCMRCCVRQSDTFVLRIQRENGEYVVKARGADGEDPEDRYARAAFAFEASSMGAFGSDLSLTAARALARRGGLQSPAHGGGARGGDDGAAAGLASGNGPDSAVLRAPHLPPSAGPGGVVSAFSLPARMASPKPASPRPPVVEVVVAGSGGGGGGSGGRTSKERPADQQPQQRSPGAARAPARSPPHKLVQHTTLRAESMLSAPDMGEGGDGDVEASQALPGMMSVLSAPPRLGPEPAAAAGGFGFGAGYAGAGIVPHGGNGSGQGSGQAPGRRSADDESGDLDDSNDERESADSRDQREGGGGSGGVPSGAVSPVNVPASAPAPAMSGAPASAAGSIGTAAQPASSAPVIAAPLAVRASSAVRLAPLPQR